MALELKQSLKLSQSLVMTPQLQQAIKLLQLNRMELAEHCMTEMMENPMLEEFSDAQDELDKKGEKEQKLEKKDKDSTKEVETGDSSGTEDINWENYLNASSHNTREERGFRDVDPDAPSFEANLTRSKTLAEHLEWQVKISDLDSADHTIASRIIGNLDENGYLRQDLHAMADKLGEPHDLVEYILQKIQTFDPVGVGARDLRECLLLQLRHLPEDDVIVRIVSEHLPDLEKRKFQNIAKALNIGLKEVKRAVGEIENLEPRPGRQFYDESAQYITPDIYVHIVNGEPEIIQNDDGLPKLRVSRTYRSAMEGGATKQVAKEYLQDKLRSAIWLIRSIHQRQRTIFKVTESIVKIQRDFLEKGVSSLKPMVLKDVAEDIGMHESTVSRVTTNKYVHTPQGIFELKFFFNSAIKRLHGNDVASEAVKERIRKIIGSEDPKKPYSDQELVELLRQNNIDIARRTVAKYRESLRILSSSKRKQVH